MCPPAKATEHESSTALALATRKAGGSHHTGTSMVLSLSKRQRKDALDKGGQIKGVSKG